MLFQTSALKYIWYCSVSAPSQPKVQHIVRSTETIIACQLPPPTELCSSSGRKRMWKIIRLRAFSLPAVPLSKDTKWESQKDSDQPAPLSHGPFPYHTFVLLIRIRKKDILHSIHFQSFTDISSQNFPSCD